MAENKIPAYRIIALANLDLEQHIDEKPLTITGRPHVRWEVEETPYHYIAKGVIRTPIEIWFGKTEGDEEPEVRRVIISGKRRFDARLGEIAEDAPEADEGLKDYGVDKDAARAESFNRYKKTISG